MNLSSLDQLLKESDPHSKGGQTLVQWTEQILRSCLGDLPYLAAGGLIVPQFGADEGRPQFFEIKSMLGWEPAADELLERLWLNQSPESSIPFPTNPNLVLSFEPISQGHGSPIGYLFLLEQLVFTDLGHLSLRTASNYLSLSIAQNKLTSAFRNLASIPPSTGSSVQDCAVSIAKLCRAALGVNTVIIWEFHRESSMLKTLATAISTETARRHQISDIQPQFEAALAIGKGLVGHASKSRKSLVIADADDLNQLQTLGIPPPEQPGLVRRFGWRAVMVHPLVFGEQLIGAIASYGLRPRAFGSIDEMIQDAFAQRLVAVFTHFARVKALSELEDRLHREAPAIEAGWEAISTAHDLRDDLFVASQSLDNLIKLASQQPEFRKSFTILRKNVSTAHQKTQLLTRSGAKKNPHLVLKNIRTLLLGCKRDLSLFTIPENISVLAECDANIEAAIDEELMRRALNNILSNALYFLKGMAHRANKTINLSASVSDKVLSIECKDNGPGIPEENLEQVFDFYFTTKGDRGLGFGLAIAKTIVTKYHSGTIRASSEWGEWTKFTIEIPIKQNASNN